MKYKAIMFDLDGTLLPMDMEQFTNGYFKLLAYRLRNYPIDTQTLIKAIWAGTGAMIKNDGTRRNSELFWQVFEQTAGYCSDELKNECDDFYGTEFIQAKQFTGSNLLAAEAVKAAREKADYVILATNPLFPKAGQVTRMGWVGLKPDDFNLVTDYESDSFCKPNPSYYLDICRRMNITPDECLHIGNDEREDMYACSEAGMDGYLVTDCLISYNEHPWTGPKGTFKEMTEMLQKL